MNGGGGDGGDGRAGEGELGGSPGGGRRGGGDGGCGGGGAHSAESPAKSRLRPVQLLPMSPSPTYHTRNVASMCPSSGRKKNCTPRDACSFVRAVGSVGLSDGDPAAVDVNVCVASLTCTVELIRSPELGRRGVT
jgi:hypothetical protein